MLFSSRLTLCSFPARRIIELNGGQSPLTYKRFQTLIGRMESVEMPAESVADDVMGKCRTPMSEDHDDKFGVPSLEELGECGPDGTAPGVWGSAKKHEEDLSGRPTSIWGPKVKCKRFVRFIFPCRFRH